MRTGHIEEPVLQALHAGCGEGILQKSNIWVARARCVHRGDTWFASTCRRSHRHSRYRSFILLARRSQAITEGLARLRNPRDRGGIFTLGCPRSGTTLLEAFLALHPDLVGLQ